MAVLVNSGTASAAEIVSGAVQVSYIARFSVKRLTNKQAVRWLVRSAPVFRAVGPQGRSLFMALLCHLTVLACTFGLSSTPLTGPGQRGDRGGGPDVREGPGPER